MFNRKFALALILGCCSSNAWAIKAKVKNLLCNKTQTVCTLILETESLGMDRLNDQSAAVDIYTAKKKVLSSTNYRINKQWHSGQRYFAHIIFFPVWHSAPKFVHSRFKNHKILRANLRPQISYLELASI